MNKEEIFQKVQKTIMDTVGLEENEVMLDADFINDLGCDSLGLSELIMTFEDKFDMRISDLEAEKLRSVKNVVDYVFIHQRL